MGSTFDDRLRGMIFGQAVGSAVGLSVYGRNAVDTFKVTFPCTKPLNGQSSNDCLSNDWGCSMDQSILLMEMLCETDLPSEGKFDTKRFAEKLMYWSSHGFPELADTRGVGLDPHTTMVINDIDFPDKPEAVSKRSWKASNGKYALSGGVGRSPIMALANIHSKSVPKFMTSVADACTTTHYDSRCIISSWTISLICRQLLFGEQDISQIYTRTVDTVSQYIDSLPPINFIPLGANSNKYMTPDGYDGIGEYNYYMCVSELSDIIGTPDYTYRAMAYGVWALPRVDFKRAIVEVAMECGCAEVNTSIVGAILGAKLGYSRLPQDWVAAMPHTKWLHAMVNTLMMELTPKSHIRKTGPSNR